jgi:hypothetical protein
MMIWPTPKVAIPMTATHLRSKEMPDPLKAYSLAEQVATMMMAEAAMVMSSWPY